MKLPRFTSGGWGKLTYAVINQAFEQIEKTANAARDGGSTDAPPSQFVAKINGLTTNAVQGSAQTTEVDAGATLVKSYMYDWSEISVGIGSAGVGSGFSWADANAAQGTGRASGMTTTYSPAIDIATSQRYNNGDIVLITRANVRVGSVYSAAYLITGTVGSLSQGEFLARLTAKHPTIAGLYAWIGLDRYGTGSLLGKTLAVNLYELNSVRSADNYASALYNGSNNWGHGQSLTGASSTITASALPVGAAGTGTITAMHKGPSSATKTTATAGAFVVGVEYTILTVGTTDFTAIGASSSVVGVIFTSTGVGVGTGTATWSGVHYWFYAVAPVSAVCDI